MPDQPLPQRIHLAGGPTAHTIQAFDAATGEPLTIAIQAISILAHMGLFTEAIVVHEDEDGKQVTSNCTVVFGEP